MKTLLWIIAYTLQDGLTGIPKRLYYVVKGLGLWVWLKLKDLYYKIIEELS